MQKPLLAGLPAREETIRRLVFTPSDVLEGDMAVVKRFVAVSGRFS